MTNCHQGQRRNSAAMSAIISIVMSFVTSAISILYSLLSLVQSPFVILFVIAIFMAIGSYILIHSVLRKQYSLIKDHGIDTHPFKIDQAIMNDKPLAESPEILQLGRFLHNCRVKKQKSLFRYLVIWIIKSFSGCLPWPRNETINRVKIFPRMATSWSSRKAVLDWTSGRCQSR